ncbi:hypothetical protein K438DRAFT_1580256 [Mycena galopus ATCC 62051]|nr:hypothetical protein K438DRAFT_1580256 [Mycena galopus ATCC 62051]
MSLTILWDGVSHYFEARPGVVGRGIRHHNAELDKRINSHVYLIHTGILGAKPRDPAILKIARDAGEIAALALEASIYATQLAGIQGKYVPHFYGIYHGAVDGSPVACMLLEHCVPGKLKLSYDEKNRKIMLAACAVHAAGIMHCDLENSHHFVLSGADIKVVDFSCAVPHRCYGCTPTLHPGMGGPASQGCRELEMLERTYGIFSSEPFPITPPLPEGNPLRLLARRIGMI